MKVLVKAVILISLVIGMVLALVVGISAVDNNWPAATGMACLLVIGGPLIGAAVYAWTGDTDSRE